MNFVVSSLLMVSRLFDRVSQWFVGFASFLLLAMVLLINVEVFGRYLFNYSTLISDEYSGYLFTWITLICFFYALRYRRLLRVEAVIHHAPPRLRNILELGAALVGLCVSAILVNATWTLVSVSWMFNSVSLQPSQTPLYVPEAIVPTGFVLLCLGYLERMLSCALRLAGVLPDEGDAS